MDSMNIMKFIIAVYKMILLLYVKYRSIIHKGYTHVYNSYMMQMIVVR